MNESPSALTSLASYFSSAVGDWMENDGRPRMAGNFEVTAVSLMTALSPSALQES